MELSSEVDRGQEEARYFPVSPTKLVIMSVCTLGLYELYWKWNCWEYIKLRDRKKFNPFWRAVYISTLFFNFLLFWDVSRQAGNSKPVALAQSLAGGLVYAGAWFAGFAGSEELEAWPLIFIGPLVYVPIQNQINRINAAVAPDHERNSRFTRANLVVVFLGASLIALALVDTYSRS